MAVAAGDTTATDLFVGSAASTQIDWSIPFALGTYTYTNTGAARGSQPGTFTYVEQGTVTVVDGKEVAQQTSSRIVLTPRGGDGQPITIENTDPADSTYSVVSAPVSEVPPGVMGRLGAFGGPSMVDHGSVTYGIWNFIDALGSFQGYSTPDFSKIAIVVRFAR